MCTPIETTQLDCNSLAANQQAQKLLEVRREHLRRLHRIYEDRRQVNLEAISVLVGPAPPVLQGCHFNVTLAQPPTNVHYLDSTRSRV